MKNKIMGSSIRNIIIVSIIAIFTFSGIVYATEIVNYNGNIGQSTVQYHKINNGSIKSIDKGTYCRKITNHTGAGIFIPTNTNTEWYSFLNNKPSGISISTECYIPSGPSISRVHTKPNNLNHIEVCFQGRCTNWHHADFNVANQIYFRWNGSRMTHANSSNYNYKRGSLHHSDTDSRKYYYIIER